MTIETPYKKFSEKLQSFSVDVRQAVLNVDILGALENLQQTYKLHFDQSTDLESLTFEFILGDIDVETFQADLQKSLGLLEDTILDITKKVNETILTPIKDEMQKIQEQNIVLEEGEEGGGVDMPTTEDHSELTPADILEGIENPHPSISTAVEKTVAPIKSDTSSILKAAAVTPVITNTSAISPEQPVPTPATAVLTPSPISKIAASLDTKLSQPSSTKPTEINISTDPYHEPIE